MMGNAIRVLELRSVRGTGGGPEKTILLGASLADREAFEITVCYLRDARDDVFAIDQHARALGVEYHEIVERHSFDISAWSKLRALVRARRIEIVHSHEYKTDLLAWWLGRQEGIIALATVHGWTGHSARERRFYYPLDKKVLARFPRLIAVSSQIRGELVAAGARPDRVDTILNGIDPAVFRRQRATEAEARALLGVRKDDFVIGAVGRLEPQKRFDMLLKAFARVREHLPERRLMLFIVGDGSERDALTNAISEQRLAPSCRLLGHRTDIAFVHHAFDLFVQSSDYEGTPNATLEAMALETPVVSTNAGGTAELVRDGVDGIIVPQGDPEALAAAIERAIVEAGPTAERAANARRRVENDLSFRERTRKVETIYRTLAGMRRSRELVMPPAHA